MTCCGPGGRHGDGRRWCSRRAVAPWRRRLCGGGDPELRPIDGLADSVNKAATRSPGGEIQGNTPWPGALPAPVESRHLDILRATMLAMRRAVTGAVIPAQLALVDGNQAPSWATVQTVIKGRCAGARHFGGVILAKTARGIDLRLHSLYPQYAFDQHKGLRHRAALADTAWWPLRRTSARFAPSRHSAWCHEAHQFSREPSRQGPGQAGRYGRQARRARS